MALSEAVFHGTWIASTINPETQSQAVALCQAQRESEKICAEPWPIGRAALRYRAAPGSVESGVCHQRADLPPVERRSGAEKSR